MFNLPVRPKPLTVDVLCSVPLTVCRLLPCAMGQTAFQDTVILRSPQGCGALKQHATIHSPTYLAILGKEERGESAYVHVPSNYQTSGKWKPTCLHTLF